MKKRGQMKLSFGMIFSIILIVVFLAFAFYGIKNFLSFQEEAIVLQFSDNLQEDLDAMWRGSSGSQEVSYSLPKSVEAICFEDDDFGNLKFEGKRSDRINLQNLDILETLNGREILCIPIIDGKVRFILEKNYGEPLVKVKKI